MWFHFRTGSLVCRLSGVWLCMTPWTVPARLLCPWDSPGKDTGVGCHFLLQGLESRPKSLLWFQGLTWSPAAPHPLLFWPITPLSAQAPALFASLLILRFICTPSCHGPWVYCPCAQALAPQTLSDDLIFKYLLKIHLTGGLDGKESACNAQDLGSIPGLERSPGGGHGSPLQYSCLILFDFKIQPFFFFFWRKC